VRVTHSAEETITLGRRLAERAPAGTVIALHGELGAGKTCFVKGLALGLGVTQEVTSPTFTIIHEYRGGRLPLYHIDLYRLDTVQQALDIGIDDYLHNDGVTVIEWAERIESLLPANTTHIRFTLLTDTSRQIEIT
jgi:tRNA threonylcarbamoyladenosine biosynthesis protein TsaE